MTWAERNHVPELLKLIPTFKLGDIIQFDGFEKQKLGYIKYKQFSFSVNYQGVKLTKPYDDVITLFDPDGYIIAILIDGSFYRWSLSNADHLVKVNPFTAALRRKMRKVL